MKTCPKCGKTYPASVAFCFRDGIPLVEQAEPAPEPSPELAPAAPPEPIQAPDEDVTDAPSISRNTTGLFSAPDLLAAPSTTRDELRDTPEPPAAPGRRLRGMRLGETWSAGNSSVLLELPDEPETLLRVLRPELQDQSSVREAWAQRWRDRGAEVGEGKGLVYARVSRRPGVDLGLLIRRLRSKGALAPELVRDLGHRLALALAAHHEARGLHGRLSPAKVLVDLDGSIHLLEGPGSSSVLPAPSQDNNDRYAFFAPEQVQGDGVDPRADVYALCLVLWCLSTGRNPRHKPQIAKTLAAVAKPPPRMPKKGDLELLAVLREGLAVWPADRPQSALALAERLEALASPVSTEAWTEAIEARLPQAGNMQRSRLHGRLAARSLPELMARLEADGDEEALPTLAPRQEAEFTAGLPVLPPVNSVDGLAAPLPAPETSTEAASAPEPRQPASSGPSPMVDQPLAAKDDSLGAEQPEDEGDDISGAFFQDSPPAPPVDDEPIEPVGRNNGLLIGMAIAALLMLAGGGYLIWQGMASGPEPEPEVEEAQAPEPQTPARVEPPEVIEPVVEPEVEAPAPEPVVDEEPSPEAGPSEPKPKPRPKPTAEPEPDADPDRKRVNSGGRKGGGKKGGDGSKKKSSAKAAPAEQQAPVEDDPWGAAEPARKEKKVQWGGKKTKAKEPAPDPQPDPADDNPWGEIE